MHINKTLPPADQEICNLITQHWGYQLGLSDGQALSDDTDIKIPLVKVEDIF